MKRILLLWIFSFSSYSMFGQCDIGNYVIDSVEDIVYYNENYFGCTEVTGNINVTGLNGFVFGLNSVFSGLEVIHGDLILDTPGGGTDNFPDLHTITGNLSIYNGAIINFDYVDDGDLGLTSLQTIGGDFIISGALTLENFLGLENLSEIGGDFLVEYAQIDNFIGLSGLTTINGNFFVIQSQSLTNFQGLENLSIIHESFQLGACHSVINYTGLDSLGTIEGSFFSGNNGDLQDFTGLISLGTVGGDLIIDYNPNLQSLSGLGTLQSVGTGYGYLRNIEIISNNNLTDVSGLGNVQYAYGNIRIENNLILESLNGFFLENETVINGDLILSGNSLQTVSSLSNITQIINGKLWIYEEYAGSLQGLGNLISVSEDVKLQNIGSSFYEWELVNFHLTNLANVGGDLYIGNCDIDNLDGFENLVSVGGDVTISSNSYLENLNGLNELDYTNIDALNISSNAQLSVCANDFVCDYISNFDTYSIGGNAEGCNSVVEIEQNCALITNTISGVARWNTNNDDCLTSQNLVPLLRIDITNNDTSYSTFTSVNGEYSYGLPDGDFDVSMPNLPNYFAVSPNQVSVQLSEDNSDEEVDFCVTTLNETEDVLVSIIPLNESRPGFVSSYELVYSSLSTSESHGEVVIYFNDMQQSYSSSSQVPDIVTATSLSFDYLGLQPFESRSIVIHLNTLAPPTVNANDVLQLNAEILPIITDDLPENNNFVLEQIVVNSYDPNDKQVLQGEEIYLDQVDEYLDFVIRFQNTGSASAINVKIEDQLSENLDWSTIQPISASHEYRMEIINGDFIKFIFEDINLPAQQDDDQGSNGYVAYRIKPKSTVGLGSVIYGLNSEIYFDFNAPITTNYTTTTVVEENLSVLNSELEDQLVVYPNPVLTEFKIETSPNIDVESVEITNLSGKVLYEFDASENYNIEPLSMGVYLMRIYTKDGVVIKKIIKQ